MERPFISIVIPAYNESARIGTALGEVVRVVRERAWQAEVLVVNNGIKMLEDIAYIRWEAFAGAYDRSVVEFTPEWPVVKG